MRPVLVPSSYAPHFGGVEQVTGRLADQLVGLHHQPLVLTNRWPKSLPADETLGGVPIRRHVFRVPEPTARQLGGWLLTGRQTERKVVRQARDHEAELVNVHCVSSNARYALAVAQQLRLPLVVSLHGELSADASAVYARSAQLRRAWRQLIQRADVVTAPSQHSLTEAVRHFGEDLPGRPVVLRNGVDVERFARHVVVGPLRRDVLVAARLVRTKGVDVLVRAWGTLGSDVADHRLLIAGDGPELPVLRQLVDALGLADGVVMLGRLDADELAVRMGSAAMVVVPSRVEPLGLVALEAMAAGAPVLASRVGGLPEIVRHGVTGLLVDPEDVDGLASAIRLVLSDPHAAQARSHHASAAVREMTWSAYAGAMVDIYAGLVGAG